MLRGVAVIREDPPGGVRQPGLNERLWRYVDFSKYVAMLTTGSLWFSRADELGDPFEGSLPHASVLARESIQRTISSPGALDQSSGGATARERFIDEIRSFQRDLVRHVYVSCWHCSDWESAAMWRLYMKDHGIAIVSTYERMADAIATDRQIYIGHVNYVDYDRQPSEDFDGAANLNVLAPYFHKRQSYAHEKEVRAVLWEWPRSGRQDDAGAAIVDLALPSPTGMPIEVRLSHLIEQVRVAPDAPEWFADAVREVTRRFGLDFPVEQVVGAPMY